MKPKTKRTKQKYLSLLLIAAILLITQVIPAQTNNSSNQQPKAKKLPSNPIHHCTKQNDDTDDTDWSYIYFGSYPQTEVTRNALTSAIIEASYDFNGDALVDGTKYRRISKRDTNYDGYFGDSDYRYFKWEPIKWRVLQNNGSTLFVMADNGLDCKDYNEEFISVTWSDCTLRNWLNSSFYHVAFSGKEQEAVINQNTNDKVYLLSVEEATTPSYGFCKEYNTCSASRHLKTSDYAHVMGAYKNIGEDTCNYWLRSPGNTADSAATIPSSGQVFKTGCSVCNISGAVVPALHINLSSDLWSMAEDENN